VRRRAVVRLEEALSQKSVLPFIHRHVRVKVVEGIFEENRVRLFRLADLQMLLDDIRATGNVPA
jgi:hypothetical protein